MLVRRMSARVRTLKTIVVMSLFFEKYTRRVTDDEQLERRKYTSVLRRLRAE